MDMQMRHGFAAVRAVVDDDAVSIVCDALVEGDFGGGEQQVAEQCLIGILCESDAWDDPFWDDENMDWSLRRNVAECEALVVFIDDISWDLAISDFFKKCFLCHVENVPCDCPSGKFGRASD